MRVRHPLIDLRRLGPDVAEGTLEIFAVHGVRSSNDPDAAGPIRVYQRSPEAKARRRLAETARQAARYV